MEVSHKEQSYINDTDLATPQRVILVSLPYEAADKCCVKRVGFSSVFLLMSYITRAPLVKI